MTVTCILPYVHMWPMYYNYHELGSAPPYLDGSTCWTNASSTLDRSTPSKKFLKAISQKELSHIDASQIVQFRIGTTPVNQYLRWIRRVDSARCPVCGDKEETVEHFLLFCPAYAHERWVLTQQAKKLRKPMTMEMLLGTPEMIREVMKFIRVTNWFRQPDTSIQ